MNKMIYVIVFSSFYKAAYAQDVLSAVDIKSTIKKAPSELSTNCSYALFVSFLKADFHNNKLYNDKINTSLTNDANDTNNTDYDISSIAKLLRQNRLTYSGIYLISGKKYRRLGL